MFKFLKRWIVKRALPEIIDNIEVLIQTVDRPGDKMLEVEIKIFDFVILHRMVRLADIADDRSGGLVRDFQAKLKARG